MGVRAASEPPVTTTSLRPLAMFQKASPIVWLPEAQALDTEKLGPRRPNWMAMLPLAALDISRGTQKGETLLGPFSSSRMCWSSISLIPPMPVPTMAPMR